MAMEGMALVDLSWLMVNAGQSLHCSGMKYIQENRNANTKKNIVVTRRECQDCLQVQNPQRSSYESHVGMR